MPLLEGDHSSTFRLATTSKSSRLDTNLLFTQTAAYVYAPVLQCHHILQLDVDE
jgi:hypothetical protein